MRKEPYLFNGLLRVDEDYDPNYRADIDLFTKKKGSISNSKTLSIRVIESIWVTPKYLLRYIFGCAREIFPWFLLAIRCWLLQGSAVPLDIFPPRITERSELLYESMIRISFPHAVKASAIWGSRWQKYLSDKSTEFSSGTASIVRVYLKLLEFRKLKKILLNILLLIQFLN